jgi:hypothetical protein
MIGHRRAATDLFDRDQHDHQKKETAILAAYIYISIFY